MILEEVTGLKSPLEIDNYMSEKAEHIFRLLGLKPVSVKGGQGLAAVVESLHQALSESTEDAENNIVRILELAKALNAFQLIALGNGMTEDVDAAKAQVRTIIDLIDNEGFLRGIGSRRELHPDHKDRRPQQAP